MRRVSEVLTVERAPGNVEPFVQIIDACGDVVSVRPEEVPELVRALRAEAAEAVRG